VFYWDYGKVFTGGKESIHQNHKKCYNVFMKKAFCITFFISVWIFLPLLVFGIMARFYVALLAKDFPSYNFGFSWNELFVLQDRLSIVLPIIGIIFGLWQGFYWWDKKYKFEK